MDVVEHAKQYLAANAAESGADVLIDELIKEAERLRIALKAQDWQPIETAPRNGSRILAWHPEYSAPLTVQLYGDVWGIHYELPRLLNQPTLWTPVPTPPVQL